MVKRLSFRSREEVCYLSAAISALSQMDVPENLLKKVIKELEKSAFNWLFPIETKLNLLYFCYRHAEHLKGTRLEFFPPLLLSFIRDKRLTEGEKNFVWSAASSIFRT
jgi:hypothetical protein